MKNVQLLAPFFAHCSSGLLDDYQDIAMCYHHKYAEVPPKMEGQNDGLCNMFNVLPFQDGNYVDK